MSCSNKVNTSPLAKAVLQKLFPQNIIYPATHNLDIRGFLKRQPIKPFGFSITEKGKNAINKMMTHMESQLAAHLKYYEFVIDGMLAQDTKRTKEILKNQVAILNQFLKDLSVL